MTDISPSSLKMLPMGQYEYVDVTFTAANTETIIKYSILRPATNEDVRWIDVKPSSVYSGAEAPATVFRSGNPTRMAWGTQYIALMSNVAGYSTRLLLFTERI